MENELFKEVVSKFDYEMHPLILAAIEECCENVLNSQVEEDMKVSMVIISLISIIPILKGTIEACFKSAEIININYRGQTFVLSEQSQIFQQLIKLSSKIPE
jgi:hypothetical protein